MAINQYEVYIENDPIVANDEKLVLLQSPALKSQLRTNHVDQLHLLVKPKCMKLKLEVNLNCHSRDYSTRRAELLAEKSKPLLFPNKRIDKNIYTSTRNAIDDSQLFVCKTVGNKLICRPISDVVTLRSDLTHFDIKEEVDPREEVRPVSVKFAATDRQNAPAKPRESQTEIEESLEEYRSFKLLDSESHHARLQREYLFGISEHDVKVKVKPDPDAVTSTAVSLDLPEQKPVIVLQNPPDVKPKIEKMDVYDIYSQEARNQPGSPRKSNLTKARVKECLLKAKLVSFEEIYRFVRNYRDFSSLRLDGHMMIINIKDIIDALNEYAVLVQGNWAIKSELLYGDSTTRDSTDVTGVPINLFIAARDYLLWLFNQDECVSRPSYTKQVRLPDHDVLELFNQLGTFRRETRLWGLKLPKDNLFLDKFPEVVQRQSTFWKVRKANKLSVFLRKP